MGLQFQSIREASTRSDFIKLMDSGLKTSFFKSYKDTPSEYEQFVSSETSTKSKETYPALSGVGDPGKVLAGEEFPEGTNGELQDVEVTNYKYGRIMAITREMVDFDQTKKIKQQPKSLGKVHKEYENKIFFSTLVNGTTAATCYDGLAIFTTNHLNRKGGAAQAANDNIYTAVTMSAGAAIVVFDMINLWKGLNDEPITVTPVKVMCTTRLGWTANWLFSQGRSGIPAFAANALGPASAQAQTSGNSPMPLLQVVVSKWLSKMGGNALDWYVWTDVEGWVWQWVNKLELYTEGNLSTSWFERDVMRWKSRVFFGQKLIDWRTVMLIS